MNHSLLQKPLFVLALILCASAYGEENGEAENTDHVVSTANCLYWQLQKASPQTSVEELHALCDPSADGSIKEQDAPAGDILRRRRTMESLGRANRFLLTPHNRNYLLPARYSHDPNHLPFDDYSENDLQHTEVEFQLSMKVLLAQDLFHNKGNLYVAYTNHSFWQAYNGALSRPFRETNHEPELIVSVENDWEFFGFTNEMYQFIVSHQSNGQSGSLSRSWNRLKLNAIFSRGNFVFAITPWYRLPEEFEDDDNPDIKDYYGNYELTGAYTRKDNIFSFMLRRPLNSRSTVELGWSFPISSSVRGYLKYFNGYGASMIDYDINTEAVGLGVIFTDLF